MFLLKRKDPSLTISQSAILCATQFQVRGQFIITTLLLWLLVGYTSFRSPHKFVRVIGECESNWLQLGVATSHDHVVCCGDQSLMRPPCYSGMDLTSVLVSVRGAWIFPMVTIILNYIAVILGPNATIPRIRVLTRRAGLYLGIMAFRTVVLYMGLGRLEHHLIRLIVGRQDNSCWFSELRRSGKCPAKFDHSDHIVLYISHYLAITLFEWFALDVEIPHVKWYSSIKKLVLRAWMTALISLTVYILIFTASYFHSPMENLVACVIAQLCVMLPLYLLSQDYFTSYKWLRLKNFVLPADSKTE